MRSIHVLLAVCLLVVVPLMGCSDPAGDSTNVSTPLAISAVDYGNGVYYFTSTSANFGNQLSRFVETHPELEVVAITGNGNGSYGRDVGYFVVFRHVTPR